MADYAGFVPRRLVHPGALASVHEAAASDGRDGRWALKIFNPPPSTSVRRLLAVEGWLLAAERQQRAAKAGGAALEIAACGRYAGGAYYVTPWQERSLQPLVPGLAARGNHLRAVADLVLRALESWEINYGVPHGNLKPANVFLTGDGPLPTRTALLGDPWYQPGAQPTQLRARELAALGSMLVLIVRQREAGGWPIEEAPEWRALGRPGHAWREYCNFLLDPHPEKSGVTLAEARARLAPIPRDARPGRNVALATAAAGVAVLGTVAGYARLGDPREMAPALQTLAEWVKNPRAFQEEVGAEWAYLCRAYGTWTAEVVRNAERWQRAEGLLTAGGPLRGALTEFLPVATQSDPKVLVPEAASAGYGPLADAPPPAVREQLLRVSVDEKVKAAWERVGTLQQALVDWPGWTELENLAEEVSRRGAPRAGASLRQWLPRRIGDAGPTTNAAVDALKRLDLEGEAVLALRTTGNALSAVAAELAASGDRVQQALPGLVYGALPDRASLAEIRAAMAPPLAELQRRRAQATAPELDRVRFQRDAAVLRGTGPVTDEVIAQWEAELALYSAAPATEDPRASEPWDGRLDRLVAGGADLETDPPAGETGGVPPLSRAEFERELTRVRGEVQALRDRQVLRVDVAAVAQEVARVRGLLGDLEQRLDATLALLRPDLWLNRLAGASWQSEAARRRWTAWLDAGPRQTTAAALTADRNRFRALRQEERTLRDWLEGLEGPVGFGAIPAPDLAGVAPATAESLRAVETALRARALQTATDAAAWSGVLPQTPWETAAATPAVRTVLEAHRRWVAGARDFATDLDQLAAALAAGFGWDDGISDRVAALEARGGLGDLTGALADVLTNARRLSEVARSTDRAGLVAVARDPSALGRALTGWRRLGALGTWPDGPAELDTELELTRGLRLAVERDLVDPLRRDALLDELAATLRTRWHRALDVAAAASEANVAAVAARREAAGVDFGRLEPRAAFNLALLAQKRADWDGPDLAALRARRDALVAELRTFTEFATRGTIAEWLEKLAGLGLVEDQTRAGLSPRKAGWRESLADGGKRLIASWTAGAGRTVSLEFLLVQPPSETGTPPFFLARRTLAVGEFLDLMAARPEAPDVIQAFPRWVRAAGDSNQAYAAPMAWKPRDDRRGIELNSSWIYNPGSQVAPLVDQAAQLSPALAPLASEVPDAQRRSPLQQVPPEGARLIAEKLLGARLPTPAEWAALMRVTGGVVPPDANLRDKSFAAMNQFLDEYRAGGVGVEWRPNKHIFLPLTETTEGGRARRRPMADDGSAASDRDDGHLWPAPVDSGGEVGGFAHLFGNVWVYLHDPAQKQFFAAGGSALSPPGLDPTQPQRVEAVAVIGGARGGNVTEGFSDVGVRPAFDAPPGFRDRFEFLRLVKEQPFLTP